MLPRGEGDRPGAIGTKDGHHAGGRVENGRLGGVRTGGIVILARDRDLVRHRERLDHLDRVGDVVADEELPGARPSRPPLRHVRHCRSRPARGCRRGGRTGSGPLAGDEPLARGRPVDRQVGFVGPKVVGRYGFVDVDLPEHQPRSGEDPGDVPGRRARPVEWRGSGPCRRRRSRPRAGCRSPTPNGTPPAGVTPWIVQFAIGSERW